MSKLGRVLAALGVAGALASCGLGGGEDSSPPPASSSEAEAAVPNVLLIVADDQPMGTVERMPNLSSAPGFTSFSSYYDNNPLCCPTRATLLTGLYSHHTGVEVNLDAPDFDDSSTLATWLDDAGYETGLFGKYMNLFPWELGPDYVPPGWDEWLAFTPDAAYYDYTLLDGKRAESFGSAPADYSTDVLADRVDEFIRDAGDANEPFFAYFSPYAPHAPRTPAPRHADAFTDEPVVPPENFNRIAEGAPRWWATRPPVDPAESEAATRDQWRSLLALDDAVGRFLETLDETGQSENTVVIYLSDNGYSLGSHRNRFKDCPYEECIHLPLLVRWPGHTDPDGAEVEALSGSPDIAPTIAEAAGAQTGSVDVDGESLVPLLEGDEGAEGGEERPILLRHVKYPKVAPTFWGVRTERWTYVIYERSGERELYDNDADPEQLTNLAGRPEYAEKEAELERTIEELRD